MSEEMKKEVAEIVEEVKAEAAEAVEEAKEETVESVEEAKEEKLDSVEEAKAEEFKENPIWAYVALIAGILAVVSCSMFPFAAMAAVVCGLVGEKKCMSRGRMAKTGAVLGAVSCAMGIILGFVISFGPYFALMMG